MEVEAEVGAPAHVEADHLRARHEEAQAAAEAPRARRVVKSRDSLQAIPASANTASSAPSRSEIFHRSQRRSGITVSEYSAVPSIWFLPESSSPRSVTPYPRMLLAPPMK